MYKHHEESIKKMIDHYRENKAIKALFLIGSIATETERPDSDIDAVAIVSMAYYKQKKSKKELEEVYYGKCTYKGGYFNIHYMTHENLKKIVEKGTEQERNMFFCSKLLFCDDPNLPQLIAKIPIFPKSETASKQFKFYCTLKMFYNYYWKNCKPQGYSRIHIMDAMIYNLYRLILLENEILFPSMRKLEEYVESAPNKPNDIIKKCRRFMQTLSNEDCIAIVESYEFWTSYDYPKDHNIIMNNFADPYESQ
jgi:predicted nucleotidyltransferase